MWPVITWLLVLYSEILYNYILFYQIIFTFYIYIICTSVIKIYVQFFYESKSIKSLTNKCNVSSSFIYWGDNKLIVNIIQNIYWVVLMKYFEDVMLDKVFIFSSTFTTFRFNSMSTGLSILCLLHHVSIQSLSPSIKFSFFPWNAFGFLIFRILKK